MIPSFVFHLPSAMKIPTPFPLHNVLILFPALLCPTLLFPAPADAGGKAKVVKEAVEAVGAAMLGKGGRQAARQGVSHLDDVLVRFGDDGVQAVRKLGPDAIGLMEKAGPDAATVARLLSRHGDQARWLATHPRGLQVCARYGDDAAAAVVKHRTVAIPLIEAHGRRAAAALQPLSTNQARRLAMLQQGGQLKRIGRTEELLDVIARYGDRAMEFIWKHKGTLASAAALSAFLLNPEPYLNQSRQLVEGLLPAGIVPLAQTVLAHVPAPLWYLLAAMVGWRVWRRQRRNR